MDTARDAREMPAEVVDFVAVIAGGKRADVHADLPHLCRECGLRRSRFVYRRVVRADRTHTLCFECYRAAVNRARASRMAEPLEIRPIPSPVPGPAKRRGDRETFYRDISQRRRRAQIAAGHAVEGMTRSVPVDIEDALERVS